MLKTASTFHKGKKKFVICLVAASQKQLNLTEFEWRSLTLTAVMACASQQQKPQGLFTYLQVSALPGLNESLLSG